MEKKTDSFSEKLASIRKKVPQSMGQMVEFGKLPPQAVHIEEAVLGALMLEKDALIDVLDMLNADVFYRDEHKEIYRAIIGLFENSKPIDILTVTNELRNRGSLEQVGGAYYIAELTNRVGSSANIDYHTRILVEKFILRELIKISSDVQREAYDETTDVFDLLDKAERELYNVAQGNLKGSYTPMSTLITKSLEAIEEMSKNKDKGGLSGVPSGYFDLDRVTSGWQPSDLIIIASRPGMGKTSFVLSMARNASVEFGRGVAIFSLEMSSIQLVQRLISAEAELDSEKLRSGNLESYEWQQLNTKIDKLSKANIFIDDTPGINVFELRAKCRRLKSQHNIEMIIIDYLQLMNAHIDQRKNTNREQEISQISRALKGLAKELNVPVVALSQLSREVEKRGSNKRPILSDLRESGSIEQDADQVMFIYRPEYYGLTEDEDHNPVQGLAELIIAKNRHGSTTTVNLKFISKFARFSNLTDNYLNDNDSDGIITINSRASDDDEDDEAPF
ncbi:MAG: replicative DNA helicase [Bacteroidetes bacterium]|jgi:replicative DNA helicase|nr:replicative DNA helicase [Bacteroidota bacterium]MBT5530958.1 replicative DNA helicase [Cytophagia bacterium]MBT3422010.1 replicative DNA helicase [Bacteroidota bacterium]MBT3935894.1 replicative DNA helicase [Bacteroidota bacterium]MBT4339061.1 replicative DNA helicase [Bacteroidota bacterium]